MYVTSLRVFDVPEVLEVHEIPSEDVRMVPVPPTVTKSPLELVKTSSLLLLQEMKMELKRRRIERRMSRCFTKFPIGGLGEPDIYHDLWVFYKNCGRFWTEFGYCNFCVSWSE